MIKAIRLLFALLLFILPTHAFTVFGGPDHVKVELVQEQKDIQPGHPFWVAIHLKMDKDWHVYWKNPGDVGAPVKIDWELPPGFTAGPLQWPFPQKFTIADLVCFGYVDDVIFLSEITPPSQLATNQSFPIKAQVRWLVCSLEGCQPGQAPASLNLLSTNQSPSLNEAAISLFQQARAMVPKRDVGARTVIKQGVMELNVPEMDPLNKGERKPVVEAYFFPEQKNVIDHSVNPVVATSDNDDRYIVNLKGSEEIGAKSQILKGVLVLHTLNGSKKEVHAYDINSPIDEDDGDSLLSYNEGSRSDYDVIGNTAPHTRHEFQGGFILALLFAFVGGMILNLMPCVLPVMSLKIMSFVKMAGQSRSLTLKHGLFFTLGVLVSFWILASLILLLKAYGQSVGWGFQLQEPIFVVVLATLLFLFALNLFGVFEWGLFFSSWAGQTEAKQANEHPSLFSSFMSGILATAVATPCTGPFLGSAVGFAVTLPIISSLTIFTFLGLGMSFPYLVLSAFPSQLGFLPRPGAWMETFKQLMGFVLIASVIWLSWVFSAQTNTISLMCLIVGLFCFSIGAWVYGKAILIQSRLKRIVAYAIMIATAVVGVQMILLPRASWSESSEIAEKGSTTWNGWQKFSPELVAQLRAEGKPILIDFTAKWCLICQANHFVFGSPSVEQRLNEAGVVKLVADWTKNDPVITEALSQFGRNSVPLYVFYGKDSNSDPVILPQILTPDIVINEINPHLSEDIAKD